MALIMDSVIGLSGMDSMHNKKHVHHKGVEIMYILSGKGTFFVDSKVYDIKPNMLIFIDSDTLHCSNHTFDGVYVRDRILFDRDEFISLISLCGETEESFMQKCFYIKESIHHLFEKINNTSDEMEKVSYVIKILGNCRNEGKHGEALIDKILLHIEENLSNQLNAEIIAEAVHISQSYLNHLFKEKTGFSLMEYIKHRRILLAKALIKEERLTVSQTAQRCGYDNFSHFSRVFHQIEGISPTEYRKKLKEED